MSYILKAVTAPVVNNAGGTGTFVVDDLTRLRRFLILGCEGGTYYTGEKEMTVDNAGVISRMIAAGHGTDVVDEVVAISTAGRSAKQSQGLFALAMAARLGDPATRKAAYDAVSSVCRIPTSLFQFIGFCEALGDGTGWGRGMRRAIAKFYNSRTPSDLAHLATKYKCREGWSHLDVLRLSHVKPDTPGHELVLKFLAKGFDAVTNGDEPTGPQDTEIAKALAVLGAVEELKATGEARALELIATHHLVREHLPTELLNSVAIWGALLESMPMTAMLRNLAKMTAIGLLAPLSSATALVCKRLGNPVLLRKARVHPFSILLALKTYGKGQGEKGSLTWNPVPQVVFALNNAYGLAFHHVEPTGKRYVLGIDVSGSMGWGSVNGASCITPRDGAAAMSMLFLKTEPQCHPLAFTDRLIPLGINGNMSMEEVLRATYNLPFGRTDCAQPMLWAIDHKVDADVFVIFTDCETWVGPVSPAEALRRYRVSSGIPDAKLIVIAMTSNGFSLADPEDHGMLDVVGFDAGAPSVMREFVLGAI